MRTRSIVMTLVALGIVGIASQLTQRPITYNQGQGWDGTVYFTMAEQFARGERLYADAPYVYRPATPFLVAVLFPGDLQNGFKVVNLVACALTSALLAAWLAAYLSDWKVVALTTGLFLVQWHAPPRYVFFAPVYVDPSLLAFLLAGLLMMRAVRSGAGTRSLWLLSLVTFAGVLFRETALVLAVAVWFADRDSALGDLVSPAAVVARLRRRPQLLLPAAFGVLALIGTRLLGTPSGEYGFARAAMTVLYAKPPHMLVHAWFVTFGPAIALVIFRYRTAVRVVAAEPFLLVFLLGTCGLAWLGGTDNERFLYWGMPVVYLLIGRAVEESRAQWRSRALVIVLVAAQLVSQRVFWTLPDYPNPFVTPIPVLTIASSEFQLLDLYSFHGRPALQLMSLAEYLGLTAVLLKWFSILEPRQDARRAGAEA